MYEKTLRLLGYYLLICFFIFSTPNEWEVIFLKNCLYLFWNDLTIVFILFWTV